ncbi:MAG TPA: diacylglycerol kinase family protein [Bacteroidia bacterium]|jgi:diacylglycerol kinase (ATP)|nr:diacylglycerol kinase family protein [Bacteroidia bacterium]
MKKIAFIIHGKIRRKQNIISELESTFQGNYKLSFLISEYSGHAIDLSFKAAQEGFNYIICLGGDGSLNEVVNGVMQAKEQNKELIIKVGVLPYGTGNDFIKTTKSPQSFSGMKKLIDENLSKEIDLGLVQFKNKAGLHDSRYFINIADVGIGGIVVQNIGSYSKALGANITYLAAIFNTLLSYRNQPVKAIANGFTFEGKIKNFVVANGKYFGSGIGIAPDAEIDNGKFAIVILGEVSLIQFLKLSFTFKKCRKIIHPQIIYKTAEEITIDSMSSPQPIDMDGEFIGYTPMSIRIQPGTLTFLC